MTIGVESDDATFEQIKKQLNRFVEVIKVVDLTNVPVHMKEILYLKISCCEDADKNEIFRIARIFGVKVVDCGPDSILLECLQTESKNNDLIKLMNKFFKQVAVVRGGSVAIESINILER